MVPGRKYSKFTFGCISTTDIKPMRHTRVCDRMAKKKFGVNVGLIGVGGRDPSVNMNTLNKTASSNQALLVKLLFTARLNMKRQFMIYYEGK